MLNYQRVKHAKACSLEDLKVKWGPGPNSRHEADLTNWGMPPSVAKFHPFWYSTRFHPAVLFQHVSTPILFASIPTFFACRTASFLVFYIPKKNIYGIDDCLKKGNWIPWAPLNSSHQPPPATWRCSLRSWGLETAAASGCAVASPPPGPQAAARPARPARPGRQRVPSWARAPGKMPPKSMDLPLSAGSHLLAN